MSSSYPATHTTTHAAIHTWKTLQHTPRADNGVFSILAEFCSKWLCITSNDLNSGHNLSFVHSLAKETWNILQHTATHCNALAHTAWTRTSGISLFWIGLLGITWQYLDSGCAVSAFVSFTNNCCSVCCRSALSLFWGCLLQVTWRYSTLLRFGLCCECLCQFHKQLLQCVLHVSTISILGQFTWNNLTLLDIT